MAVIISYTPASVYLITLHNKIIIVANESLNGLAWVGLFLANSMCPTILASESIVMQCTPCLGMTLSMSVLAMVYANWSLAGNTSGHFVKYSMKTVAWLLPYIHSHQMEWSFQRDWWHTWFHGLSNMSGGTSDTTLAPRTNISSHSGPPVVLG